MATRAARRRAKRATQTTVPHSNGNGAAPVKEIIGRSAPPYATSTLYRTVQYSKSIDQTVPDYAYWDSLRRCKLSGFRLAGLFALRVERILAAWIFGEGVNVELNRDLVEDYAEERVNYTNRQIQNFVSSLLDSGQENSERENPDVEDRSGAMLPELFKDAAGLGDQYIIVNSDGTISVPSPDTVVVERDKLDYRHVLAVKVTTRLDEATIIDEYRADGRTVTYEIMQDGKRLQRVEKYPNLLGRIPVIHIAHARSGNETNGHSIHEALLPLYDQYDDVLEKMLDGVKLLGNPILALTGLEDLSAVIDLNDPAEAETYVDASGNEVNRPTLKIDRNTILAIGKGGDAKLIAPPVGFTKDTEGALNVLFWLLFEHLGIPESVWGGELSSARATSETQLIQFVKELRGWQQEQGGWINKLATVWLQYAALVDAQLITEPLTVTWPDAIEEDKALLLKFLEFAANQGLLQGETLLKLTNLVEDASAEYPQAQAEAQAKADAAMDAQQEAAEAAPVAQMGSDNSTALRAAIRLEAERMVADA